MLRNIDNIRQMNSEELAKLLSDKCNCCIGKNKLPCGCTTCSNGIKAWLEQEVTPTLTEDEKVILMNVDKKYKWIARNKDNSLRVFNKEVYHSTNYCWESYEELEEAVLPMSNLFKFIEKYDMNKEQKPYEISKLLGE